MSASLVGSEMCIRDRGGPGPLPGRRGDPALPRAQQVFLIRAGPADAQGCLLYTSDAADDM
eukprot:4256626-Alexandrium_andersonii.AAC.1